MTDVIKLIEQISEGVRRKAILSVAGQIGEVVRREEIWRVVLKTYYRARKALWDEEERLPRPTHYSNTVH